MCVRYVLQNQQTHFLAVLKRFRTVSVTLDTLVRMAAFARLASPENSRMPLEVRRVRTSSQEQNCNRSFQVISSQAHD
jgi:hypothetical protein